MSNDDVENSDIWAYPNPYTRNITVGSDAIDRLGHTNNIEYLKWIEDLAWSHIEALDCGWAQMEQSGAAFAITRNEIHYMKPTHEGEKLILGTWLVSTDQRFRSCRKFQLIRCSDNKTILNATMDLACISLKTGKPTKMPTSLVSAINQGVQQTKP